MTIFVKLPPNNGHPLIADKFFKTCRYLLFRDFTDFHMKTKILVDFQICISVPLKRYDWLKKVSIREFGINEE